MMPNSAETGALSSAVQASGGPGNGKSYKAAAAPLPSPLLLLLLTTGAETSTLDDPKAECSEAGAPHTYVHRLIATSEG